MVFRTGHENHAVWEVFRHRPAGAAVAIIHACIILSACHFCFRTTVTRRRLRIRRERCLSMVRRLQHVDESFAACHVGKVAPQSVWTIKPPSSDAICKRPSPLASQPEWAPKPRVHNGATTMKRLYDPICCRMLCSPDRIPRRYATCYLWRRQRFNLDAGARALASEPWLTGVRAGRLRRSSLSRTGYNDDDDDDDDRRGASVAQP